MKLFLSHLWLKWREAEGLPITQPYAIAHGGHEHVISPDEMLDKPDIPAGLDDGDNGCGPADADAIVSPEEILDEKEEKKSARRRKQPISVKRTIEEKRSGND